MPRSDDDFLPALIGILERLHAKSAERGDSMLAFLLGLAKTEAEDELKCQAAQADRRTALRDTSSQTSWRPAALAG
jgi:hypothetical protein